MQYTPTLTTRANSRASTGLRERLLHVGHASARAMPADAELSRPSKKKSVAVVVVPPLAAARPLRYSCVSMYGVGAEPFRSCPRTAREPGNWPNSRAFFFFPSL